MTARRLHIAAALLVEVAVVLALFLMAAGTLGYFDRDLPIQYYPVTTPTGTTTNLEQGP